MLQYLRLTAEMSFDYALTELGDLSKSVLRYSSTRIGQQWPHIPLHLVGTVSQSHAQLGRSSSNTISNPPSRNIQRQSHLGQQLGLGQSMSVPNSFVFRQGYARVAARSKSCLATMTPRVLRREGLDTTDSTAESEVPLTAGPSNFHETFSASSQDTRGAVSRNVLGLTHVKSSGEAHMVDVSAKADSRRVAIACSTVEFSTFDSFRLVLEDKNKKGDVLGVSRVAGIMGAKRTSDLIPLCHPLAITKAEVDLKLAENGGRFGAVDILAHVECVGPTGIEMEALTAATTAALTVYDMCKAADRSINIRTTSIVYKSGGRSGLYVRERWATRVGQSFFLERGLEVPPFLTGESIQPEKHK